MQTRGSSSPVRDLYLRRHRPEVQQLPLPRPRGVLPARVSSRGSSRSRSSLLPFGVKLAVDGPPLAPRWFRASARHNVAFRGGVGGVVLSFRSGGFVRALRG